MKTESFPKLLDDPYSKKKYEIHMKALKQALDDEFKLNKYTG